MNTLLIFAVIALLGLSVQSHASELSPPSVSSGEFIILPSPKELVFWEQEQWNDASRKPFKSGKWLALACDADKCRLVLVMLEVTNTPRPKGAFFIPQTMKWDLSAIHKGENIVMFVMPHAGLEPGAVQTWYAPLPVDSTPGEDYREDTGKKTVVATALADKPDRKSIIVPMEVANESCTEAQAVENKCQRKTIRVQLLEGKTRQWMGAPLADRCYPMGDGLFILKSYLRWVGDLDHDQKPDYIINLGLENGYILLLSSLAKPGQLVGEAGHYHPGFRCD